ncbi:MAG: hypothetical protein K2L28_06515 [Muribaculaceae bacterium]|nr:hypothetical protein [Muribaculaceae bacterium]
MKKLLLTLLLVVSLGALSAFAAESSYTITFKSNNADSNTALTNTTYSKQIESGAEYISGLSGSVTRVYSGKNGLKFGSGGGGGTITFNLEAAAQVVPTKITVSYAQFSTDKTGLTVNGLPAETADGVHSYKPTTTEIIKTLKLESTKRVYVKSITVYYNDGEEVVKKDVEGKPYEDLTLEDGDAGTFASSIANFESGVTNLVLESSDKEGLLIDGLEYLAMKEGSYVVNVTWAEGSIYKAGTSSFNVTVKAPAPKFEFKSTADKATLGKLYTLPELNNTYDVQEYTLASSDETVAILSPVDGKSLWIVGKGTTTITATLAGRDDVKAPYELTVSAPQAMVEESVTFNFDADGVYGMTAQSGTSITYLPNNFKFEEGAVSATMYKDNGEPGRLWTGSSKYELRVMSGGTLTLSVPEGSYITKIEFTNGNVTKNSAVNFTEVNNDDKSWTPAANSKFTSMTFNASKRSDIASIKVTYATEQEVSITTPDLKFSKLIAFGDCATIKSTATVGEGVAANVEYLVNGDAEIEAAGDELIVVANPGEFDVTAYVAPADGVVPAVKHGKLIVKDFPEEVYMIGHYYDRYYDITTPIVLAHQGEGIYTHTENFILLGGSPDEGDYGVVFTTAKFSAPVTEMSVRRKMHEHATDWAAFNEGEVIHAAGIHTADEITAPSDLTSFVPETGAGKYVISLDLATSQPKFVSYTDTETGIEDVTVEQGEATYYDLTGRRVANPAAGAYIRVQGGKAQKVMFK